MFVVKCSWCTREISRSPGEDGISHGICPSCYEKTMRDIMNFSLRDINPLQGRVPAKSALAEHC